MAGPGFSSGLFFIRGAEIRTVTRGTIKKGDIILKDGKISEIGENLSVPEGSVVIEASGKIITPGLIDSHSHLGTGVTMLKSEENDGSGPSTPHMRILDSMHPEGIVPHEGTYKDAVAEGVTTVISRPGSGNVIGGQSLAIKLSGKTVDDMILRSPVDMKMAMGPKRYPTTSTRMGVAQVVRQAMLEARKYKDSREKYESDKELKPETLPPERNLTNEAMLKVLNRELPVHIHCSPIADILTAIRLGDEFNFLKLSLAHGDDTWRVADELAKRGIVVVVGPNIVEYDDQGNLINLPQYLVEHGVEINIMTDTDIVQQEYLRFQAAVAIRHGLDPDEALKAITINPARLIAAEDRIGSLEAGKDADLVIFDGDPFDFQTSVLKTFINGELVFEN
jgi:imidazolonepropionase-like amidohydrolase